MRPFRGLRYSAIGVFFAFVLSAIQGCDLKEAAVVLLVWLALVLPGLGGNDELDAVDIGFSSSVAVPGGFDGKAGSPMIFNVPTSLLTSTNSSTSSVVPLQSIGFAFLWDFGDGTMSVGNPVTHTFTSTGTFTATLTITSANSFSQSVSLKIVIGNVTTVCVQPPADMSAWMPFDETLLGTVKELVNNNDGKHINSPKIALGKVANSINLPRKSGGVNRVIFPDNLNINLGLSDFTIEFWIKSNSNFRKSAKFINKCNINFCPSTRTGYIFFINRGHVGFIFNDDNNQLSSTMLQSILDAKWHHVSVSVDRDQINGGQWYLDGNNVSSFDPTKIQGSLDSIRGMVIKSFGRYSTTLDEFSIYKRNLSLSEIRAIFNAGSAGKCKPLLATISFTVSPPSPSVGEQVTFVATTDLPGNLTYNWAFGDGGIGTGQSVNHTYTSSGGFLVVLTVNNDLGQTVSSSQSLNITSTINMYWTDDGSSQVVTAQISGTGLNNLVAAPSEAFGIAVDTLGNKVYWTQTGNQLIRRANLDGSNAEDLFTGADGLGMLQDIALDVGAGKMYWLDSGTDKLQRANMDGSGAIEDLFISGINSPRGIALDIAASKVYWTDATNRKVHRANMDGAGIIEDLVTTGIIAPGGIALDVAGGKMYWTERINDRIRRANLDGSNIEDIITTGLADPNGIALDVAAGKMYWTDRDNNTIKRANLDGSNIETIISTGLNSPRMLDLGL